MRATSYVGHMVATVAIFAIASCGDHDAQAVGTSVPSPTAAAGPQAPGNPMPAAEDVATCEHPVRRGETAAEVLRRFGKDARRETLPGPEGTDLEGVVLWGGDPARRMELLLGEDTAQRVAGLRIGEGSRWQVAELRVGDDVAAIRRANGAPFEFYGFSWDYGGYLTNFKGGTLGKPLGDCTLSVRLTPAGDIDDSIMGEGEVSSDHPAVAKARPVISELSLNFGE